MKRLLFIASLLLLVPPSEARRVVPPMASVGGGSFLVSENCEGTGTPATWTDAASPDWDYTTTVLEGSQSLKTSNASSTTLVPFTSPSTVWVYCLFRTAALNDQYALRITNSGTTQVAAVRFLADGRVRVYSGTGDFTDTSSGFVAANTTYSIWLQYVKGTGANSVARVFVATTTTKPATTAEYITGTETTDPANLYIFSGTGDINIWDHIRVSSSTIGSAP